MHAFVISPGFEEALRRELPFPLDGPQWPSVLSCRAEPPLVDPAFARQQLPAARLVRGESVRALAGGAFAAIDPALDAHEGPFALHVFVPGPQAYRSVAPRAPSVERALLEILHDRRRRASRRRLAPDAPVPLAEALLVQLALVGRTVLLASVARPRPLSTGGFDLAPWPAGLAAVPEDKTAPSRAYRKLVEGFAWLGARPGAGETCVDLGGAPGGWAWTALSGGARVIAVDRSPLAPPALGHPALTMVQGNAFTYVPPAPVDWLLCDVICEPKRTIDLAARWMKEGWCRRLCATLKFKGEAGYGAIADARRELGALGWSFLRVKHMENHHNEAVILASK